MSLLLTPLGLGGRGRMASFTTIQVAHAYLCGSYSPSGDSISIFHPEGE